MGKLKQWWDRIFKSFVQGGLGALVLTQVLDAVTNKDISALETFLLTALGGGVMAVVTTVRVLLIKPPNHTGIWGVVERAAWTFIAGAFAAVPVEVLGADIAHLNLKGLGTVLMGALLAGVAALVSFAWNLSTSNPATAPMLTGKAVQA